MDYDNDGYVDLSVANFRGNNRLYHNEGDGTFKSVTGDDTVNGGANESWGVVWGDFDNNLFPDLFVANGGVSGKRNFLYRNNGGGTFTRIISSPIVSTSGHFIGGAWADYNRDGSIDLFVANNSRSSIGSLFFHNNGDGTFTRTNSAIAARSDAISGAWADFDNNGWPDLLVANGWFTGRQTNFLYSNTEGVFGRVAAPAFSSLRHTSIAVAWGDSDNNGFPDVFVANVGLSFDGVNNTPEPNELYRSNGDGSFDRATAGDGRVELDLIYLSRSVGQWGDPIFAFQFSADYPGIAMASRCYYPRDHFHEVSVSNPLKSYDRGGLNWVRRLYFRR